MSVCRVLSCVVGRGCLLWSVRSLGKTLLAFALLHSVFQGPICLYPRCFLGCWVWGQPQLLIHSSLERLKSLSTFANTSNTAINCLVPTYLWVDLWEIFLEMESLVWRIYILKVLTTTCKLKHMVFSWKIYHTLGNVKKERCEDVY